MIELPEDPFPVSASVALIDAGDTVGGAVGGADLRVDRPGSRYQIEVTYPPMRGSVGRLFVARLIRGKQLGIRIPYPLQGVNQGSPGSPVVDGADQQGKIVNLRGCTPGHVFKEGFWTSLEDANGHHYLDNVAETVRVEPDGTVALPLALALRTPFADGAIVHAAKPMIQGLVVGDEAQWQMALADFQQISFTIKEAA